MASRRFNVVVVGYGLSAKVFHIPLVLALPDDFKLFGIVQRSPKPNDDASKDHPDAKVYRSIDEVYTDPDVDVIVISLPPETHFSMTKAALEAGKNVVVEKPFVPTAQEANELCQVAKKSGKLLTVYQNRRWDADFLTLKNVLSQGHLGDVADFDTRFDRYRPDPPAQNWKAADKPAHGSLYDLGSHLIDQIYHLYGMPKKVTALLYNQRRSVQGGAHDSHTALLHYDGMLVTTRASVISSTDEQLRYWVRGTKGSFKKYHVDLQEDQLKAGTSKPGQADYGVDPEANYGMLTTAKEGGGFEREVYPTVTPATYVEYYRLFARALRGDGEVPVSAEDARDVLRILEAAALSSREGRTVEL